MIEDNWQKGNLLCITELGLADEEERHAGKVTVKYLKNFVFVFFNNRHLR